MEKEIKLFDCVSEKEFGEYLGRVSSIEKGVARVQRFHAEKGKWSEKWPIEKLYLTHFPS
jgi:hypothetical protein